MQNLVPFLKYRGKVLNDCFNFLFSAPPPKKKFVDIMSIRNEHVRPTTINILAFVYNVCTHQYVVIIM